MLFGVDVSEFQGQIDWDTLNANSNFVIIRSSFGTTRADLQFARNQTEARRVRRDAGPLGIGYYHYAYPEYNSPEAEADFFCNTIGELEEGELLALDWEETYNGDHAAWALTFLQRVEANRGVKPVIYLNQSLVKAHDWTTVINGNYGLWLAQYDEDKNALPVSTPWPVVAMKQWGSDDAVRGIAGKVDGDTFYGDFDTFYRYGYQKPGQPTPEVSAPTPALVVPEPVVAPSVTPVTPTVDPQPAIIPAKGDNMQVSPKLHEVLSIVTVVAVIVEAVAHALSGMQTVSVLGLVTAIVAAVEANASRL